MTSEQLLPTKDPSNDDDFVLTESKMASNGNTTLYPPLSSHPQEGVVVRVTQRICFHLRQWYRLLQTPLRTLPSRPIPNQLWKSGCDAHVSSSSASSSSSSSSTPPTFMDPHGVLYVYPPSTWTLSTPSFTGSMDPYGLIWQLIVHLYPVQKIRTHYTHDYLLSPTHTLPCLVTQDGEVCSTFPELFAWLTKHSKDISKEEKQDLNHGFHPFFPFLLDHLYPALVYTLLDEPKNQSVSQTKYIGTHVPYVLRGFVFRSLRDSIHAMYFPSVHRFDPSMVYARAQTALAMMAWYLQTSFKKSRSSDKEEEKEDHGHLQKEPKVVVTFTGVPSRPLLLVVPPTRPPLCPLPPPPSFVDICLFAALHTILSQEVPMERLRGHVLKNEVLVRYTENFVAKYLSNSPPPFDSTFLPNRANE
ncbi:hypothetical protein HMI54_001624 [Coelomomyces lativittatus]|nr:hypothetical protein HMI55_001446 [Coelomomyces lativittatus]KAJ1510394.1 hypothetical protein HMI54_001624 [Coelomomyces lativittatus]KAJ1510947.1 hypothetical protein HMI56_006007 [Coelomomyces lativittatus]